jgi:hypothetical protein
MIRKPWERRWRCVCLLTCVATAGGVSEVTAARAGQDRVQRRPPHVLAASAGGNSLVVKVATTILAHRSYSVTLMGGASERVRLYLFVDYKGCAHSPAVEHARAGGEIWYVNGAFHARSRGWRADRRGRDYACGYLQDASLAVNSGKGVIARDVTRFRVR